MAGQRRWGTVAAGIAALVGFVALAGCGADRGFDDSAPVGGSNSEAGSAAPPEPDTGGEAGAVQIPARHVIYTGAITLQVDDVDTAAEATIQLAARYQGFVAADRRASDQRNSEAHLVLRIPSERFTEAVSALADLGDERHREIRTEDVTADVVDITARVATMQASVERTRELLAQAQSISDIVRIEAELTAREADLASLQARQQALEDLTTLSTIEVTLLRPDAEEETRRLGFVTGLTAGWEGFQTAVTVLLTMLGFVLPFLLVLAVPASVLGWWLRQRRRRAQRLRQPAH